MAHEGFSLILNLGVGGFGNGHAQQGFQGALSQLNNYNSFKPSSSSETLSRSQSLATKPHHHTFQLGRMLSSDNDGKLNQRYCAPQLHFKSGTIKNL